jgi:hypothetical protein
MISGTPSSLFEELGLYYIGPVDGHNMDDLVAIMQGGWGFEISGRDGRARGSELGARREREGCSRGV